MSKLIRSISAQFFLLIYCSYFFLSCSYFESGGIDRVAMRIDDKLARKDYRINGVTKNPYQDGQESARFFNQIMQKYGTFYYNKSALKAFNKKRSNFVFQQASLNLTSENPELETMGIDVEGNYNSALEELTNHYSGIATNEEISQALNEVNNLANQYPLTYSGAEQLFTDYVNTGMLTQTQSSILQSELEALIQASSVNEMILINQLVEQEVINSTMSREEKSLILNINAQLGSILEDSLIAFEDNGQPPINLVGMASWQTITAFGLMLAGIAMMTVGAATANPILSNVGLATACFGFGFFID